MLDSSFSWLHKNSDGSSLGNPGVAGFGDILRRNNRDWIMGYSGHISRVDNLCTWIEERFDFGLELGVPFGGV